MKEPPDARLATRTVGRGNAVAQAMASGRQRSAWRPARSTCVFRPRAWSSAVRLLLSVKRDILTKRGCRACDVAAEAADASVVHYREEWESGEVLREHVRSEEFRRVLIAMDMSSEEPRIVVGNLSGHGGMEYLRELREPDPRPNTEP